eukprot:8922310-Pyramimonas_sp.AAC.1
MGHSAWAQRQMANAPSSHALWQYPTEPPTSLPTLMSCCGGAKCLLPWGATETARSTTLWGRPTRFELPGPSVAPRIPLSICAR